MRDLEQEGRRVVQLRSGRHVYEDEAAVAWGQFIAGLRPWDCFGGFTFDPSRMRNGFEDVLGHKVPRRVTFEQARRAFESWAKSAGQVCPRGFEYVAAIESHKNGSAHLHPLLFLGGLQEGDIARIGQLWYQRFGYANLTAPRDNKAVSEYAAKYLSKDVSTGTVLLSRGLVASLRLERVFGR